MVFWRKRRQAVGVVLDGEEVRAVEVEGNPQSPELTAWGRISLPRGSISEGEIADAEGVGHALAELWEQWGFVEENIILGISNQAVFVRFAKFPKLPPEKIEGVLSYQAQEFFPFPLANAVMDYAVLEGLEDERNHQLFLIVAAPRELIEKHIQVFSLAGLQLKDVNVVALCLRRLFSHLENRVSAVVEVGCESTNILIASGGDPRFLRFIPKGVGHAARILGYSLDSLVSTGAASYDEGLNEDIEPWRGSLAQEVASSLSFFESQDDVRERVQQVFLCGRGAYLPGFDVYLQNAIGIPVHLLKSFPNVKVAPECMGWEEEAAIYASSLALALRGLEV